MQAITPPLDKATSPPISTTHPHPFRYRKPSTTRQRNYFFLLFFVKTFCSFKINNYIYNVVQSDVQLNQNYKIMTNLQVTSATVIRNLVSSVFKVDPTKVYLSPSAIDPNYQSIYSTLSGGMWSSNEITTLWGFSPQTGFKEIKDVQYSEWNTPDGMPQNDRGNTLKLHEVPGIEGYIFFLEKRECHNSIPSNGVNENSITWKLYKAPNFKEFWAKIEREDLERWSEWLNINN